jgi:chromosome segregation ATPase
MQEKIEYLEGLRRILLEKVETLEAKTQSLREDTTRLHQENTHQLHFLILTTKRYEQLTLQFKQLTAQYELLRRRNQQLTGYTERLRGSIEVTNPDALMVWSEDEKPTSEDESLVTPSNKDKA